MEDRVPQLQSLFGKELFRIEHQNAVLMDDADHHDRPHERGDIQR